MPKALQAFCVINYIMKTMNLRYALALGSQYSNLFVYRYFALLQFWLGGLLIQNFNFHFCQLADDISSNIKHKQKRGSKKSLKICPYWLTA